MPVVNEVYVNVRSYTEATIALTTNAAAGSIPSHSAYFCSHLQNLELDHKLCEARTANYSAFGFSFFTKVGVPTKHLPCLVTQK